MNTPTPSAACPKCGRPIPPEAREELCPSCALAAVDAPTDAGLPPESQPSPPTREAVAAALPQFAILELIGRGGMGSVFKAHQPQLNRVVALKILPNDPARDPKFAERFLREAQALARLDHPNIVTVHDSGEAGGFLYLVMEYVDGASLRQLLRERRLQPEEALAIVPRICEALQFAHEQGVVHRDIKPENVLIDRQGRVKIADFGIAKLVSADEPRAALTEESCVIGTPHYMAPEQVERPRLVDHRADIYSLGVVFYEMLTGELPLGKFPPPSRKVQLDVRLDEVVLRTLEKEPERRYQHASEVKNDVETIAQAPRAADAAAHSIQPDRRAPPSNPAETKILAARWSARILGTLLILFVVPFILAEGLPPIARQPEGVQLTFLGAFLLLLGFLLGWWREGTAAVTIACGWTVVRISESAFELVTWFELPLVVAALYAFCWWATRGRPTRIVITTTAVLAATVAQPGEFTLTVTPDGRGTHASIQAALDAAPTNAVIRVAPGRFAETLLITNSVTLVGANWNTTVIGPLTPTSGPTPADLQELERRFRETATDEERTRLRLEAQERFFKPVVRIANGASVQFENLKLTQPGSAPDGKLLDATVVEVRDGTVSFRDCAIVGSPGNGLILRDGAKAHLTHTLVAAAWNTGIRVERGARAQLTITDSDIRNCHYAGVVIGRGQDHVHLERCRISGAAWHGVRYDSASPTVADCLIFANARSGIYASGSSTAQVHGNVLWKNEMNGMSCWFANRDSISNNTFAANLREGLSVLGTSAPLIARNIFWQNPQGIYQGNIGGEAANAKASAPLQLQTNLFWTNTVHIASTLGATVNDASAPPSLPLEHFPGNVELDPGFRDSAVGDFSLPLQTPAAATAGIGAPRALQPNSPFPLQPEESAIIPESDTRDSRQWKRPR